MTAREVPVSDCPEPCACYAAGRGRAYFEVIASFKGPPHAEACAWPHLGTAGGTSCGAGRRATPWRCQGGGPQRVAQHQALLRRRLEELHQLVLGAPVRWPAGSCG